MGREAPAPKAEADTPSSCDSVSPSELPALSRNSSPASTFAGVRIWSFSPLRNGDAVTITCWVSAVRTDWACAGIFQASRMALASSVR